MDTDKRAKLVAYGIGIAIILVVTAVFIASSAASGPLDAFVVGWSFFLGMGASTIIYAAIMYGLYFILRILYAIICAVEFCVVNFKRPIHAH